MPREDVEYQMARDGRTFGPYTEPEVRERLLNGHVLATDIARSEGMEEWLPVSVLFPSAQSTMATPLPGGLPKAFADPPNLNWIVVLVLGLVTGGGFSIVWSLVQTAWLKRVQPRSTAIFYYIALAVLWLIKVPQEYQTVLYNTGHGLPVTASYGITVTILSAVFYCASHIVTRSELLRHFNREEPIGLQLSWLLSLLFGDIYFQYHLSRINAVKRTLRTL